MEKIDFDKIIKNLFSNLNSKESEILRARFGLENKRKETLEIIGKNYGLSKERIRQVQNYALDKLRQLNFLNDLINPVRIGVLEIFNRKGGIVTEKFILKQTNKPESFSFIISHFLEQDLEKLNNHPKIESAWKLKSISLGIIEEFLEMILNFIKEKKCSLKKEELLKFIKESPVYKKYDLNDEHLLSYLETSKEIKKNVLGMYGLSVWREITPKRIADKIYLIFQKEKKPLHFSDLTQKINELKFDHKVAYPRAVHNELILDERYVLIGRGVYALKEWGYQKGTVKDILINILKKAKKPLSKEELAKEIQSQRFAKESTVYTALMDKKSFKRQEDGKYTFNDNNKL
ncbi:MAG: hypothetical protein Athens101410_314 [Parcubacteria group bacterium Athens1014_10]|nr:MAG: hypothetical protein Athens101410_314 [Parcubacteria group bacterium Athens1014_10]TSD05968.1 MAG: hypothetical protein Athens071412_115 [Parcubacteria group bacterium Athens0714_12]